MRILQISCGYYTEKEIGGTEVYVHNLSEELISQGHEVFLNYIINHKEPNKPFLSTRSYIFKKIKVFVIEVNTVEIKTKVLYLKSERYERVFKAFEEYLKSITPDVVHFHHFSPTDVIAQIEAGKKMQKPVVLTYHTPMMTCGRGDMFYLGKLVCDGRIDYKRCLVCMQVKYGICLPLAWLWANLPKALAESVGKLVSGKNIKGRFSTWLQLPWLTKKRIDQWGKGLKMIDHFVAVSQWVYDLLLINRIPEERITLTRHCIGQIPQLRERKKNQLLRLGYLGRIHPLKGTDLLLKAFKLIPAEYKIELYIYGFCQDDSERKYYNRLINDCSKDSRIKWSGKLPEEKKFHILSQLDVLVVPSRWLETGPLVLLEAWAAGTAVIGTRRGGISELVKDGQGGLLFDLNDVKGLAELIKRVYSEPGLLEKLKSNIPAVCTTRQLAKETADLYKQLCQETKRFR